MPMSPRLLRPRQAGVFDPRTVAGLQVWWDAADSASVTLDGGRLATLANKSGVTSPNRNAVNATSGSTQPDYILGARNGRNVVRFAAASSQRLNGGISTAYNFLHGPAPSYIAMVVACGGSSNPNVIHTIMANGIGANNLRGTTIGYIDTGASNDALFVDISNGAGVAVGEVARVTEQNFLPAQATTLAEVLLDNANATAAQRLRTRSNGLVGGVANTFTNAPSTLNAQRDFFLGCNGNQTGFLTGDICEILMYSQHPTEAAQTALRRYLAAKWGVTLA